MPDDIEALRKQLAETRDASVEFFARLNEFVTTQGATNLNGDQLYGFIPPNEQACANSLRERLGLTVTKASEILKGSALITEPDLCELRRQVRRTRAALRFRVYKSWDQSLVSDEDRIMCATVGRPG